MLAHGLYVDTRVNHIAPTKALRKIEVLRDDQNSKSGNKTSSGEWSQH